MPEQDEFFKPDTDFIPDEGPEQNIPDEGPEQPGMIDSAKNYLHSLAAEHPVARELIQRALTGTSPEFEEQKKAKGVTDIQGPELMKIPGLATGAEKLKNAGINTGNYWGGVAGSVGSDILGLLEGGFDPRTAGVKTPNFKLNPVEQKALDARIAAIAAEDSPKKFYKPVKGLLPARSQATDFIADERGNVLPNQPTTGPLGETVSPDVAIQSANVNPVEAPAKSLDPAAYAEAQRQAALAGMNTDDWIRVSQGLPPYPREAVNPATMSNPPVSGDTGLGFSPQSAGPLPYPLNVIPNRFRPRAEQTGILNRLPEVMQPRLNPIESGARTVTLSDEGIRARTAEPYQTPELPSATKIEPTPEPPLPGRELTLKPITAETPKSVEIPKGTGKLTLKNPDPADVAGLKNQGYVVTNQTSKSVTLSNSPRTAQAAKALEVSDFTDKPSLSTRASEILKNFINETSGEFNPGEMGRRLKRLFNPEEKEILQERKVARRNATEDFEDSINPDTGTPYLMLKGQDYSAFNQKLRDHLEKVGVYDPKGGYVPKWKLSREMEREDNFRGTKSIWDSLKSLDSDEEGSFKPKELIENTKKLLRLKGKTADEVSTIREGIISGITQEGRLDIPRVFNSVSSKISRPQFDKILNDIIESGDLTRLAAERRAKNLARDTSPMQMSPSEESPVSRLLDAVRQHTGARQEQDLLVSQEKARRFSNVENAPGTGVSRFFNQAQKLKGAYPKVDVSAIREAMSSVDMDSLMDMADQSSALKTTGERFRTKMAIGRVLGLVDKPGALQPNEIELLSRTYGPELANQLVELHGGLGAIAGNKAWGAIKEVNNLARTLWTSLDFSAPLRQGQGLMLNKEYLPAFREMFKYGWSEKNYADLIEHLNTRPNAELGRKSGLFISNVITDSPSLKEEMYLSKLAEKIPGVRGSERAYTGFLDKLRADVFDRMIGDAQRAGVKTHDVIKYNSGGQQLERIVPTQFSKDLAKYINRASGRGSLGKIGAFSDVLSTAGFSPRYQASRVQMLGAVLNPETYVKLDPAIRRQYLKSMLALGGMVGTSVGLSRLLGHEVSLDPRSSDFMKGRFGERTRQDAGASYLQYITLAARLATNQTTDQSGDTKLLDRTNKDGSVRKDEHSGVSGRLNTLGRFARSKESPLLSFVHDWINQKDYLGRPFSANKALADRFVPAVIQDVMALKDEDPDLLPMLNDNWTPTMTGATKPELLPLAAGSLFGVNANVYDNPQNR